MQSLTFKYSITLRCGRVNTLHKAGGSRAGWTSYISVGGDRTFMCPPGVVVIAMAYEFDGSTFGHPEYSARASFDLTTFGDAETWREALEEFDLTEEEVEYPLGDTTNRCWVWHTDDLAVRTYNNPLTGEYSDPDRRDPEPGYASYIHVEGTEEAVETFYNWVQANATHIKEAALGEWVV